MITFSSKSKCGPRRDGKAERLKNARKSAVLLSSPMDLSYFFARTGAGIWDNFQCAPEILIRLTKTILSSQEAVSELKIEG